MRIDSRRTSIARLAALVLILLVFQQASARAQGTAEPITLMSPSFGLGPGQGLRFTLFLRDTPVRARVMLHDERGDVVAESRDAEIPAGGFHSFRFDPGDIHLAGEGGTGRRQLRASCWIRVGGPWAAISDLDVTLAIIEVSSGVTDGTSNTVFFAERWSSPGGGGATVLTSGVGKDMLAGIAPRQAFRLSAFHTGPPDPAAGQPDPIRLQVNAYDESGRVVAISREVEIQPGHFGWVSVTYDDLDLAREPGTGRAQVRLRPFFKFTPGRLVRAATSLEIVGATGNTLDGPQCLVFYLGGIPTPDD